MKNYIAIACLALSTGAFLTGCAHNSTDQKIDNELAQETTVNSRSDLNHETANLIEQSPGMNADQRAQLEALRRSTHTQLDGLRMQSLKLRSLMVKDLVATDYDAEEVARIQTRIKDVENKKLSTLFDAAGKANTILGRQAQGRPEYLNNMLFDEGRGTAD